MRTLVEKEVEKKKLFPGTPGIIKSLEGDNATLRKDFIRILMTLRMKEQVGMIGEHLLGERKEMKSQRKRTVMRVKKRVIVIVVMMMKGVGMGAGTAKRKAKIPDRHIGPAR